MYCRNGEEERGFIDDKLPHVTMKIANIWHRECSGERLYISLEIYWKNCNIDLQGTKQ